MTTCRFCAEELSEDATKCPNCGEDLDRAPPPVERSPWKLLLVLVPGSLLAVVVLGGLATSALMRTAYRSHDHSSSTKCRNNLRQVALAAIQYADDKRFFPHVRPFSELDGDVTTSDTPRVFRAFIYYGYMDDPDDWICPSSVDIAQPWDRSPDQRGWHWEGKANLRPLVGPFADPAPADPTLDRTHELSYGWTRRGLDSNARSSIPLAADRAVLCSATENRPGNALVGNHSNGWNVVRADASVETLYKDEAPFPGGYLAKTSDPTRDGFLSILDQDDPTKLDR